MQVSVDMNSSVKYLSKPVMQKFRKRIIWAFLIEKLRTIHLQFWQLSHELEYFSIFQWELGKEQISFSLVTQIRSDQTSVALDGYQSWLALVFGQDMNQHGLALAWLLLFIYSLRRLENRRNDSGQLGTKFVIISGPVVFMSWRCRPKWTEIVMASSRSGWRDTADHCDL
jgi:hypothetical protein